MGDKTRVALGIASIIIFVLIFSLLDQVAAFIFAGVVALIAGISIAIQHARSKREWLGSGKSIWYTWLMQIKQGEVPPPGEGKIIGDAAVYNDNGTVRAMSKVCTHLGCSVVWSGEEKSFNCPCHGSKFNPDGSVKNGPAEEPLEPMEISIES